MDIHLTIGRTFLPHRLKYSYSVVDSVHCNSKCTVIMQVSSFNISVSKKQKSVLMNSVLTTFLLIYSLLLPTRAMALEQFSYEEGYENCVDYYIRVKFNNSYEAWQRESKRSRQGIKVQAHAQCK